MWCRCGKGKSHSFTAMPEPDKGDFAFNYDFWVCSSCLKPSRLVFEKVTDMLAPSNATALLSIRGRYDGVTELVFATLDGKVTCLVYHPYPRKVGMDQGRGLLLKTWELLDAATDTVMKKAADPWSLENVGIKEVQAEARAYANVLAMFMEPFFTSADDIVREAVTRYKARQAGVQRDTPGLAEHIWDPRKDWDGSDKVLPNANPQPKVNLGRQLTSEEAEAVANALSAGMFTVEQLAEMFKTSTHAILLCKR